ncbi:MAG: type 4b pilus protein PilO2 [Bacteroidales bacterium]|nr:type 4b pilus protein PilO2 [Bacteroidales bacterium]
MKENYNWKYASVGGSVRVKLESGADIANLGELDRKKWTVLSCPTTGLEFDEKTLKLLDADGDGRIHVDEVIAAAQWVTGVLKDPDLLLKGQDFLKFSDFDTKDEEGAKLEKSAKQILANLKIEKDGISLAETSDNEKIFAETQFNGDGIITEASADDEALKETIKSIIATVGSSKDRSGADGVTADQIEAFYTACADYSAWKAAEEKGPFGDNTEAALAACEALKEKIADWFMRCKLISFNDAVAGVVDVSVDKVGAISDGDLAAAADQIATYPLARPVADGKLPLKGGINPAWKGAFATLKALVFDVEFPKKDAITEEEWLGVLAKFDAYTAWKAAKKGAEVEPLGIDVVNATLKADKKAALLELIEKDKALEPEALSIEAVDKLLHYVRDFYKFLKNYVVFEDFYSKQDKAIFQAGRLYIDQRSTDLCVKVIDAGKAGDISSLSGMYILYCNCINKVTGKGFPIAAVLTDGDVNGLRPGKNAIFYDREGVQYDATVTSIVDNPISLRQAFWAPYKKVAKWISDKVDKSAAEKESKSTANLTASADKATSGGSPTAAIQSSFDIAKFAGIFAAIGMALGLLGQFVVKLVEGMAKIHWWQFIIIIIAIMLVISLPSVFIAWRKLRRRDLGPVLNANGWAVNAAAYVKPKFGKDLTQLVKYPKLKDVDPEEAKKVRRRKCLIWIIVILLLGGGGYFGWTRYQACKAAKAAAAEAEQVEAVEETAAETADAETAEVAADATEPTE